VGASDVFSTQGLTAIRAISRAAQAIPGVAHVQSITEVLDVETTAEGSTVSPLVGAIPQEPRALSALRAKVLSREGIAGNLVSRAGDAAVVVVTLAPVARSDEVAAALRARALESSAGLRLAFVGAPFVADYVASRPLTRLGAYAPFAALVFVGLLGLFAWRTRSGAAGLWMPLVGGGVGVLGGLGAIAVQGDPLCAAAATTLVAPFVAGVLAGAWVAARGSWRGRIALGAFIAALAMGGAAAFLDPMEIPVIAAVGLAFVALAAWLLGVHARPPAEDRAPVRPPLALRVGLGVLCAGLAAAGAAGAFRLEPDRSGFGAFGEDEEPKVGEAFLRSHFEFGDTVFVRVRGALRDPRAVRYLEVLEEGFQSVPGVASVESIVVPLRLVHHSMTGRRQLPDTPERLAQLWAMLEANPDVRLLVNAKRTEALLHVRIAPGAPNAAARVAEAAHRLRQIEVVELRPGEVRNYVERLSRELARRFSSLAVRYGKPRPQGLSERLEARLQEHRPERFEPVVRRAVDEYFASDEALVSLRAPGEPESAAAPRAARLARKLAPLVLPDGPAASAAQLLRAELPPGTDEDGLARAAPMLLERARSAALEEFASSLSRELGEPLRAGLSPARAAALEREMLTVFYGALDRSTVAARGRIPVAPREKGWVTLDLTATGPALAVSAAAEDRHRRLGWGALVALGVVALAVAIARRSPRGAAAALPGVLALLGSFGFFGLTGVGYDAGALGVAALAIAAGALCGTCAAAGPPVAWLLPPLAVAGALATLALSGFAPLARFGILSALALTGAGVGAAWLRSMVRPAREE
jgi:hypothetical protein